MRTQQVVVAVLLAGAILAPLPGQDVDVALQRAVQRETVSGDLNAAIREYRKIVAQAGSNRAVAASALVHMAECYRKVGDAESRKIYEQVVRDYGDQKDAVAEARMRLGVQVGTRSGILAKQIWKGPKVYGWGSSISPDGRWISFTDWETGDLAIHDVASGADRRLTNKGPWSSGSSPFAEESMFSPDGKSVAYAWFDGKQRYELRVMGAGVTNGAPARVLYRNEDIAYIAPFDWSPDGKWIAVDIARDDRTVQIGLVDAQSGSLRVLKSGEWNGAGKLAFSPDSRYLAFDRPDEAGEQSDVFVLAVDGSREIPVVVHPATDLVAGWSGDKLLFTSDRTGTVALWEVALREGQPQGAPEVVKSAVGPISPLGITRSGGLYYGVKTGGPDIYSVSVDFASAKLVSAPEPVTVNFMGSNRQPDWSPDGKSLAYVTQSRTGRFATVTVQSLATGKLRQISPRLSYVQWPRWSPDGTELLAFGVDLKGRQGIFRIDAQTGDFRSVLPLGDAGEVLRIQQWAPDGKHIYYGRGRKSGEDELVILERDLESGKDREVFRTKGVTWQSVNTSPDGHYMAFVSTGQSASEAVLSVASMSDGVMREVARLPAGEAAWTAWTPDGNSVLVSHGKEIWMAPVSGGPVRKMDIGLRDIRGLRVQPGGSKIAFFTGGANQEEVWALENFLPARSK